MASLPSSFYRWPRMPDTTPDWEFVQAQSRRIRHWIWREQMWTSWRRVRRWLPWLLIAGVIALRIALPLGHGAADWGRLGAASAWLVVGLLAVVAALIALVNGLRVRGGRLELGSVVQAHLSMFRGGSGDSYGVFVCTDSPNLLADLERLTELGVELYELRRLAEATPAQQAVAAFLNGEPNVDARGSFVRPQSVAAELLGVKDVGDGRRVGARLMTVWIKRECLPSRSLADVSRVLPVWCNAPSVTGTLVPWRFWNGELAAWAKTPAAARLAAAMARVTVGPATRTTP